MLIKSTEMGVYIKWALLLQEELQRSLTLHSQLQQMRGKLESENSELSMALGRPDPRPAASAEVASRGSSTPSALPSVAELQRLAGASAGGVFGPSGTGGCMCSGIRHASPQVAPPTGKRNHAAMVASAWQASERPTSVPSRGVGAYPAAQLNNASLCAPPAPDKQNLLPTPHPTPTRPPLAPHPRPPALLCPLLPPTPP